MASSNFIGSNSVKTSEPAKQEAVSLEYRIVVGIDANPRLLFFKKNDVKTEYKKHLGYFSHGIENPNKETFPQCDTTKEEYLYCNISNINSENAILEKIDKTSFLIQNKLKTISCDKRYKEIYVRVYLLGKGIDKIINNIFYIITGQECDSNNVKNKIDHLLSSSTYKIGNIKKIQVECIQCLETTRSVSLAGDVSVTFPKLGKAKICTTLPENIHSPQDIDFQAGIFMCQYGYESINMKDGNASYSIAKTNMANKLKEYGGWQEVKKGDSFDIFSNEYPKIWDDMICDRSGFFSQLFHTCRGGKEVYAFCTAGTQMSSLKDWFSNFSQGLFFGLSPQYTRSVKIAKKLDKIVGDKRVLFFVGHSLGGGLASNNALITRKRHAITYNAAGLNFMRVQMTLLLNKNNHDCLFDVMGRQEKIHPRIIQGEVLNTLVGVVLTLGSERAYGSDRKVIRLQQDEDRTLLDKLNVAKRVCDSLKKHAVLYNFFEINTEDGQSFVEGLNKD